MYIRATGIISPQKTFGHPPILEELVEYTGNRLSCIEPEYKDFIDVKLIRRMSRIIRMGVTAAMECLQEAECKVPDAIITGTAYGCLEDTGSFMTKMVEFNEELLTPTAFIQSTHNTIGAQIGLILQCHHYNNAFVHRGFSFESALLDGMILLNENEVSNVLVGAIDEITNFSHAILNRFGLYKQGPVSNLDLFNNKGNGTIAGEGASFFLIARDHTENDYAKLDALHTFYKPNDINEIKENILSFLNSNSINLSDIDLVITGRNGDKRSDEIFDELELNVFERNSTINFKNLSGEYPTATAFALWLGVNIIKSGSVPETIEMKGLKRKKISRVLIYNHYEKIHHSLILISAC